MRELSPNKRLGPQSVKLSSQLVNDAEKYGKFNHRSKPSQIEYWARNGKIAEENPDLPFSFIRDAILSHEEVETGETTPFLFGDNSQ